MSVALYDKAIKNKIAEWVLDPNMTVLGPDETKRLFQYKADVQKDKPLTLPLIVIGRDRDIDLSITAKRPLSHSGKIFNADNNKADHLNAVPITLKYQIDIYTRFQEEADEYIRNFVFQVINYPKLEVEIPYNKSQLSYISYMTLANQITDNSDISERLVPGQFTRMTLRIQLNDAYLFSYNHKSIPKVSAAEVTPILDAGEGGITPSLTVDERDTYSLTFSKNLKKQIN